MDEKQNVGPSPGFIYLNFQVWMPSAHLRPRYELHPFSSRCLQVMMPISKNKHRPQPLFALPYTTTISTISSIVVALMLCSSFILIGRRDILHHPEVEIRGAKTKPQGFSSSHLANKLLLLVAPTQLCCANGLLPNCPSSLNPVSCRAMGLLSRQRPTRRS